MSRKCKFDLQWEQALSLLEPDEALQAREVIETYQQTGVMPEGLTDKQTMILLLVMPTIDRRRRQAASARKRRLSAKQKTEQPRPANATEVVESENKFMGEEAVVPDVESEKPVRREGLSKWLKLRNMKRMPATWQRR